MRLGNGNGELKYISFLDFMGMTLVSAGDQTAKGTTLKSYQLQAGQRLLGMKFNNPNNDKNRKTDI